MKFFLRFSEKDVIIQHIPLIIFEGIIFNHRDVRMMKLIQSTIAQMVDKIKYKNACRASSFVFLRKSSSLITSKIRSQSSFSI